MNIRFSTSAMAAGALVAIAVVGAPASAVNLVNTQTPVSQFGPFSKAFLNNNVATNLVQRFTLPSASTLSTISFYGGGAHVDLSLTNAVGASASEGGNVLWSVNDYNPGSGRAWRDFDVTGLNIVLPAGTYYLVMGSVDPSGAIWSKSSRADAANLNAGALGTGTYNKVGAQRMASVDYVFDEAGTLNFATRIQGTPIPTPGALALGAMSGLAALRRRRR